MPPVPPRSRHRVVYNAPEAGQRRAGDTALSPAGPTGTRQRAQAASLRHGFAQHQGPARTQGTQQLQEERWHRRPAGQRGRTKPSTREGGSCGQGPGGKVKSGRVRAERGEAENNCLA